MAFVKRTVPGGFIDGHQIEVHEAGAIATAAGPGGADLIIVAADAGASFEVRGYLGRGTSAGASVTFYTDDPGGSGVAISQPIVLDTVLTRGVDAGPSILAVTVEGEALWLKAIGTGTLDLAVYVTRRT